MLQNKTMASKRGNFNMKKVPLRSFNLRSLSTANKISLKEKLIAELALVRSAIDKIGGDHIPRTEQCCKRASNSTIRSSSTKQQQVPANRKRKSGEITQVLKQVKNANGISDVTHLNSQANPNKNLSEVATNIVRSSIDKIVRDIPRTEQQCCKRASNNTTRSSSTMQQQAPANKKRKLSEITQVLKKVNNANGIADVNHLNSQANPNKVLSEVATNIDSKNSVGALRKKHCSDSNGFDESLCEKLISPTKALRAAKLKSRFADTILKAQLELRNIGFKERAFRMQREKDNLTKAYKEEQIKIEAQIKAAAAQKEKSELIMKIQKEREASRLALEKMEATVEMNDFNQVMKELKGLGCQNISFYVLRQLGLFLKDDDFDDHKTAQISVLANHEIEEGEIVI